MVDTITFISHESKLTGAPRVLYQTATKINRNRFNTNVICPGKGLLVDALKNEAIPVFIINRDLRYSLPSGMKDIAPSIRSVASTVNYIHQLEGIINTTNVSIVHVNTLNEIPGSIAALLARKPILWHIHEIPPNRIKRFLALSWARLVSAQIVVVSKAVAVTLGRTKNKVHILHNGIDLNEFDRNAKNVPEGFHREKLTNFINRWETCIVFIGMLVKEKGIDYFLEMATLLRERYPNTGYLILGDSLSMDYKSKLEFYCIEHQIDGQVFFAGYRNDIPAILMDCSIVVVPSIIEEAFPLVCLESMAASKPVIGTDVGGVSEAVEDGISGLLVPKCDACALASAVEELLLDSEKMIAMGNAGRKRVEEQFQLSTYIKKMEEIYESMIN